MSLIRYNNLNTPGIFGLLNDIFREDFANGESMAFNRNMVPAVNINETDKAYEIEMAVPGLDKKDINVEVDDNVLTISSKKEVETSDDKKNVKRREFHYSSFERSFTIPEDLDADKIDAKQENGILYVTIPKKVEKPSLKKMIKVS